MTKQPPRLASTFLEQLACAEPAVTGDLDEAYRQGRSSLWYWWQTAALIVLSPFRQLRHHPFESLSALVIGWAVFLTIFELFDVLLGRRLSMVGYRTDVWMPFQMASWIVSYAGFALSALIVAKVSRRNSGPLLVLHVISVLLAMAIGAAIVAPAPTRVPHVFFPLISVALPYQWRSGFLLAPVAMLMAGMLAFRRSQRLVPR
jgi:hypothetical protein